MRSVWLTLAILVMFLLPVKIVFASEEVKDLENVNEVNETNEEGLIDNESDIQKIDNNTSDATNNNITMFEKEVSSYKVIVHYLSSDGIKLKDDLILEKNNNENYDIDILDIDDYLFNSSDKDLSGIINGSDVEITLIYIKDETIDIDDNKKELDSNNYIENDESEEKVTDGNFISFVSIPEENAQKEFVNPNTIDNVDLYFGLIFISFNLILSLFIAKKYCLSFNIN